MLDQRSHRSAVRRHLLADHRELDGLLQRLIFAFEANAGDEIEPLWSDFESRLLAHMDAEEKYLVPCLMRLHHREIDTLLSEHEGLRKKLVELGTQLELHLVRLETARALASALHAHASHEDQLYQWADTELGERERRSLLSAIAHRILARADHRPAR